MLQGYAVLYNLPIASDDEGGPFEEVILAGAFAKSVRLGIDLRTRRPIYATVNHRRGRRHRLGDTRDGRLRLFEDHVGVGFELHAALPADFTGMSFLFTPMRWRYGGARGAYVREACLHEISLLTAPHYPACPQTRETVRVLPDRSQLAARKEIARV